MKRTKLGRTGLDIELSDDDPERIDSIMEGGVAVAGPTLEG